MRKQQSAILESWDLSENFIMWWKRYETIVELWTGKYLLVDNAVVRVNYSMWLQQLHL